LLGYLLAWTLRYVQMLFFARPPPSMERLKYAMELCSALRRVAPNCFYRLYESELHCIYAWEPRLRRHVISIMADVAGIAETYGNVCRKLMEIADRLAPR
jgi:hypothetical protein